MSSVEANSSLLTPTPLPRLQQRAWHSRDHAVLHPVPDSLVTGSGAKRASPRESALLQCCRQQGLAEESWKLSIQGRDHYLAWGMPHKNCPRAELVSDRLPSSRKVCQPENGHIVSPPIHRTSNKKIFFLLFPLRCSTRCARLKRW